MRYLACTPHGEEAQVIATNLSEYHVEVVYSTLDVINIEVYKG